VRSAILGIYEKRNRVSLQRKTLYQKKRDRGRKLFSQTLSLLLLFGQTKEDFDKVLLDKARWKNKKLPLKIRRKKIKYLTLVYLTKDIFLKKLETFL